jgi:hypothetical protein
LALADGSNKWRTKGWRELVSEHHLSPSSLSPVSSQYGVDWGVNSSQRISNSTIFLLAPPFRLKFLLGSQQKRRQNKKMLLETRHSYLSLLLRLLWIMSSTVFAPSATLRFLGDVLLAPTASPYHWHLVLNGTIAVEDDPMMTTVP